MILKSTRTTEWILGFSSERAEIAEFIPAPPGYISDNVVAFCLSCNFLEDEARCDRWRSWWKSCRGRGHVAPPSILRRDWSRQGREEGRPPLPLSFFLHFCCRKPDCQTHRTPGQRHEFSICKITLVFPLNCCQLFLFTYFADEMSVCASLMVSFKGTDLLKVIPKCIPSLLEMLEIDAWKHTLWGPSWMWG